MEKTFVIEYDGLKLTVVATEVDGQVHIEITCDEGYANINAFYWGDAVDDGESFAFSGKKDSNLNMNGTDVDWDGGVKLSDPGLGKTPPATYLQEGQSYAFTLPVGVTLDDLATIGIRATSTSNPEGSIKGVATPEPEEPEVPDHFPEWPQDISHITLYFNADEACDTNGDGVYTVKIDTPTAFPDDLDDSIDTILAWIIENDDCVSEESQLLGVAIKGGKVEEQYFAMDGDTDPDPLPNGLTELVQNKNVDQTYEYNDIFA